MAEYIKMIAVSAIAATLFFGGYHGPFVDQVPILGPLYLFIKVFILLFGMIWVRATLPRIRYDRLMAFGWKFLLPAALLNVFFTAVVVVILGG
jgi:NADH-quinone oxidoreductase subunit H